MGLNIVYHSREKHAVIAFVDEVRYEPDTRGDILGDPCPHICITDVCND